MRKRIALPLAIKAIREAKGLSGSAVATACLMSHAHLCNIESGRRVPTDDALTALAAALGVSVDAISLDVETVLGAAA